MGVNLNDNEIKRIEMDYVNDSNFIKDKRGRNDRKAMVAGLEHGHKYYCTATFVYNDWSEYKTELTVERILENRQWVVVRDTGEGRFGSFVLLFSSLLAGSFKNEAQRQSMIHFNHLHELRDEMNKTKEQKSIVKIKNEKIKEQKGTIEEQKGTIEEQGKTIKNQVQVINNQKNEIITLTDRVNDLYSKLNETVNSGKNLKELDVEKFKASMNTFVQVAETLANAKVDHDKFVQTLTNTFNKLFVD